MSVILKNKKMLYNAVIEDHRDRTANSLRLYLYEIGKLGIRKKEVGFGS